MTRIVRTHYRYKRPPRQKKAVALEVPGIITAASKRQRVSDEAKAALGALSSWLRANASESR